MPEIVVAERGLFGNGGEACDTPRASSVTALLYCLWSPHGSLHFGLASRRNQELGMIAWSSTTAETA